MKSMNGNLILKPYKSVKELQAKETVTGFAGVANKTGIESLELLVDAELNMGHNIKTIRKGSKIYYKKESLDILPWSKVVYNNEDFPEGFIVGTANDIVFIKEADEGK